MGADMGGAIIYTVIVAVWAVVLVPRWLRSHDNAQQATVTSDEDHRDEAHGRVLPRRQRASAPDPDVAPDLVDDEPSRRLRRRSYEANARAHRLAVRRRLVFAGLLLAVAGTVVAAVYGVVPGWSVGAPAMLLPLYVVHVRRVMVAEHARRRRMERERARRPVTVSDTQSDDEDLPEPVSVSAYRTKRVAPGMRVVERGIVFDQDAAEPWQPQPVPPPTYLTAPAAPRSPQPSVSIDQYDEESAPEQEAPVYDIRRAVGG